MPAVGRQGLLPEYNLKWRGNKISAARLNGEPMRIFLRVEQIDHDRQNPPDVLAHAANNIPRQQIALQRRLAQPLHAQRLLMQHRTH